MRSRSHGLRAGPWAPGSVVGRIPNSGSFVVPRITKPAARSRRTMLWSEDASRSRSSAEPGVSRQPETARVFLIAIGTPANGRASPGPDRVGRTASAGALVRRRRRTRPPIVGSRAPRSPPPARLRPARSRAELAGADEPRELSDGLGTSAREPSAALLAPSPARAARAPGVNARGPGAWRRAPLRNVVPECGDYIIPLMAFRAWPPPPPPPLPSFSGIPRRRSPRGREDVLGD